MGGLCKGFELLVDGLTKYPESVLELRDPVDAANGLGKFDEVCEFGGVKLNETAVVKPESAKAFAMASVTLRVRVGLKSGEGWSRSSRPVPPPSAADGVVLV